jgi:hypothetical protein
MKDVRIYFARVEIDYGAGRQLPGWQAVLVRQRPVLHQVQIYPAAQPMA